MKQLTGRRTPVTHHPDLHTIDVVCATCGTAFGIRSTADAVSIDVCSNCHPAFTGAERAVVSGSRVERFNRRRALAVV
jgi:large subunit ribosomal protein L31